VWARLFFALSSSFPLIAFQIGFSQVWRWNSCLDMVTGSAGAPIRRSFFAGHECILGVAMDSELRKRLDDFFDVGFGKTTGIDTALEITKIYAGSAAADPDKIPDLFVRLVQLFEPRLEVRD
jgi:hypothetical protein